MHACTEADRQGRASPRDVQTLVPADVLEYMMSCLTSKGTVEGRQDVADNVALLCAAEVYFSQTRPVFTRSAHALLTVPGRAYRC